MLLDTFPHLNNFALAVVFTLNWNVITFIFMIKFVSALVLLVAFETIEINISTLFHMLI